MKLEFLAAALTLLGAVAVVPEPKVEPWQKYSLTGYVREQTQFDPWGAPIKIVFGNKKLVLEVHHDGGKPYFVNLGLASEVDYEQAEKHLGQLVEIEAYEVTRGVETVAVPVVLRGRR